MPKNISILTNDDIVKYLINRGILDAAGGIKMNVKAKAADYTIVAADDPSGTIFTNRGAGAAVMFTLPAPSQALEGVFYDFYVVAAQDVGVKTASVDTLITANDLTADSLSIATANEEIGAAMRVVCDGTSWIAIGMAVGVGGATAFTYTVAT